MATRQYIGARYVPKFYQNSVDGSAQWESNVVYEPLTYVTLTNGHMYISKKQVPATVGSPVSNIDYWLDVGSYNGFIDQLQDEIDAINNVTIPAVQADVALKQDITDNNLATTDKTVVGAINEVNTAVGNVNTALADKQDAIDNNLTTTDKTVVGAINELDTDVQGLADDIEDLRVVSEKNILLIGNSYIGKGVCDILVGEFDHSYRKTSDGAGFVAYTDHSVTYEDLLDDAIADTTIDKDTITDILFVSAAGDPRAFDEGESAYNNALLATLTSIETKVANNFTNCKRTMITFAEIRDIAVTGDSKYSSLFAIHRAFKLFASIGNIEYLGWCGFDSMFNANNVMTDHLHPTDQGAKRIGAWLRNSYNGHAEYHKFTNRNTTMNFAYTASAKAVALIELTPDYWNFQIRTVSATSGESVTLAANGLLLDFNEFSGATIPGPSYYDVTQCVNINARDGSNIDYLILSISNDSNGVCRALAEYAPSASTISTGTLTCPELNNVVLM